MKTCLMLLVATIAYAGTAFRIEIGPPVAAGTTFKVKGAAFAARALACDDLANARVTATAETLVNGQRHSVPLQVVGAGAPGVYVVSAFAEHDDSFIRPQGRWLILVSGTCTKPNAAASTLVPMQDGAYVREKVEVLREAATAKQVETALARN